MAEHVINNMATNVITVNALAQEKLGGLGHGVKDATYDISEIKLPCQVDGPLCWVGTDFENSQSHIWTLSENDIKEIEEALDKFNSLGLDGERVNRDNFPLPSLEKRLQEGAKAIHDGHGLVLVRGLNPARYTVEDNVTIYLGVSSYIGDTRGVQDRKGNVLTHVTDSKSWSAPQEQRHGIHRSDALPFHTDMGCDILALQVRNSAKNGGNTYLSSASTVLNNLLQKEPDVVKTLFTPNWPVQLSGRKSSFYLAPAFTIHDGRLMACIDPSRFGPHPTSEALDIPFLTCEQKYALEAVSREAGETELCLKLETGDLLFLNNWALLHRRDAYKDGEETSRHLVRLWLRNSIQGWTVPTSLLRPWLASYVVRKNQTLRYDPCPAPEYPVPKYSAGSAAFIIEDSDIEDSEFSGSE